MVYGQKKSWGKIKKENFYLKLTYLSIWRKLNYGGRSRRIDFVIRRCVLFCLNFWVFRFFFKVFGFIWFYSKNIYYYRDHTHDFIYSNREFIFWIYIQNSIYSYIFWRWTLIDMIYIGCLIYDIYWLYVRIFNEPI